MILAGACIVRAILTVTGQEAVTVSDRGLRHGVVAERFGPKSREPQVNVLTCGFHVLRACRDSNPKPSDP